jgi:hypothetical protein
MVAIIRFPVILAPARRRRLARQEGVGPASFDRMLDHQDRLIRSAGGAALTTQDFRFIEACKVGLIKPKDIAGADRRAVIARRIVRDLNRQGSHERNEIWPE